MTVQYLEIVTTDVEGVCKAYQRTHGASFGDADTSLGGARTAHLVDGGLIGVRPPLRDDEAPVVRPYMRVPDIQSAVDAAEASGATVALPPMPLGVHGTCAIVIRGGIEIGLWANPE
ncbi:MAG: hydroxylase [Bacteroidota bacterium]